MDKADADALYSVTTKNGNGLHSTNENQSKTIESKTCQSCYPIQGYTLLADARNLPLASNSIDLIVTSPPYWRKRNYGGKNEIGQENTVEEYVFSMMNALREWRRVLRKTGSIFLNVGDSYTNRNLAGVPARLEDAAINEGWILRNRIIWAKDGGMPEPAKNRLANRYEFILHLVVNHSYYYDLFDYAEQYGNGSNPGDIWHITPSQSASSHLAPFPEEIVERAIILACPKEVCSICKRPRTRILRRTSKLDPTRPQARRAMEIAESAGLTPEHIAAIQATGISDAGKALKVQNGTGRNAADVKRLAAEAKKVLGGYFREFTFAKKETVRWNKCECDAPFIPATVLDPFMGSGTTLRVANRLGRTAIGADLNIY